MVPAVAFLVITSERLIKFGKQSTSCFEQARSGRSEGGMVMKFSKQHRKKQKRCYRKGRKKNRNRGNRVEKVEHEVKQVGGKDESREDEEFCRYI